MTPDAAVELDRQPPSTRRTVTPMVITGIALATLCVLGGGAASLIEYRAMTMAGDAARHALGLMVDIGRLRETLLDAENGQRGYLLAGHDEYLQSYEHALEALPPQLAKLRADANEENEGREMLASLAELEPLVDQRLDELRRTLDLHRGGDTAAAIALLRTDAGRNLMDRVLTLLGEIETQQARHFSEHLGERTARGRTVLGLIVGTTAGAVLAMVLSLGVLVRTYLGRARADARARVGLRDRLAESEARAGAVLDTVASAVMSIDVEGRIETFNQAAERMFGYTAAEMIGQSVNHLMPEPDRSRHDGYIRRYLETGERHIIGIGREVVGLRKDGTTFPMMLAVTDTSLNGRHLFTGAIHDLTQPKEAEERERRLLKQSAQNERLADVGAMTARIAHDFGNPLAGLHMTAQRILRLLARDPVPVDRLTDAANTMAATTRHLDALVGEFKEFTREQRLQLADMALAGFLQEVVRAWRPEADERGIVLELAPVDPLLVVRVDADKLRRVLENLVKNALEAIGRGPGSVRIAVETQPREKIVILVADTGPGIPEGTDVFALFETTKSSGTGLGLPICRQIVLAHEGGIEYATGPSGTIFKVELPSHGPAQRL